MYWLKENMEYNVPNLEEIMNYTSTAVHQKSLKFMWIPFFQSNRNFDWSKLGFDAATIQPNYYFYSFLNNSRLQDTANLSKQFGTGIEIETDNGMNSNTQLRKRYVEYLNSGVDYGYMNNSFKAYYQGNDAFLEASRSTDPNVRSNYDWTYQFVKGTYQKQVVSP